MLHNIYHKSSSGSSWIDVALERELVEKLVDGYLRGLEKIRFEGKSYEIGDQDFLIYEVPVRFKSNIKEIEDWYFGKFEGLEGENVFKDECINVTKSFLKGKEWGHLKEKLYNIYIRAAEKPSVTTAVVKDDLLSLIHSWQSGEEEVWIDGKRVTLKEAQVIRIYDIKDEYSRGERGEIKKQLNKVVRLLYKDSWSTSALEEFGKEITSDFKIGPYGAPKSAMPQGSVVKNTSITPNLKTSKVFISHSSKDKNLVSKFIDHVLILGLGMKRDEIFCTSLEGSNIKSGSDFRNAIKVEITQARAVIQIITRNYKASEVCLNEMGAAWVLSGNVIPLIALPFNYDLGFIHASSQQLILNRKEDILKMYDDHKKDVFPESVNFSVFNKAVDDFVRFIEKAPVDAEFKTETVIFYNETVTLKGTLREGIFQHPNETYHRFYFIELNPAVDVLSSDLLIEEDINNSSQFNVTKMHISVGNNNEIILKPFKDVSVVVRGKCWGGYTAWHQTPVMITIESITDIND